jgi:hypothetical protein
MAVRMVGSPLKGLFPFGNGAPKAARRPALDWLGAVFQA